MPLSLTDDVAPRIARFVVNTASPARLAEFYEAAFGFRITASGDHMARLQLGESRIDLKSAQGRPVPVDVPGWSPLFQHFALVAPDMDVAFRRLQACDGWTAISIAGPQRLPESSGGVSAFKFRDPEGHPLELLTFPPGQLPEAWLEAARSRTASDTCLGIDHSAISIADTKRSIAFYTTLGFVEDGGSHNVGRPQARLDGLADADVDVTALRAGSRRPPHLELLGYRGVYDRTNDLAADDLAATRIVLVSDRARPGLHRDPDGHFIEIEPSPTAR